MSEISYIKISLNNCEASYDFRRRWVEGSLKMTDIEVQMSCLPLEREVR
jgi:hypothetical protein